MTKQGDRDRAPTRRRQATTAVGVFPMLMSVIDLKDRYTGRHSASVGRLCRRVALTLGWSAEDQALCHVTGLLHDIGKIGVPDEVLRKPGVLTADEWAVLRRHPDWGADALSQLPLAAEVIAGVRSHHERWDGEGYPRRRLAADIPRLGRAVAACDAFHAMTSTRPFRNALAFDAAVAEIRDQAGLMFDPEITAALLDVLRDGGPAAVTADADHADEWARACTGVTPERLFARDVTATGPRSATTGYPRPLARR